MADTRKTKLTQASHVNTVGWGALTHDAKGNHDLRRMTGTLPGSLGQKKTA